LGHAAGPDRASFEQLWHCEDGVQPLHWPHHGSQTNLFLGNGDVLELE
jgi:hypothetical protein